MNQSSTSPRLPVTARGQRTRERLMRAAETVFGETGYDESSIAQIAITANVALGTFYVYFPDKKSAFVELVDELGARLRRQLAEATAGLTDRLEIERAGLEAFFDFAERHKRLYRIVRQAEFVDEQAFRRYYSELARRYAGGLEAAMSAHEIRQLDPETLAYCLMGLADFLGMRYVLWSEDRAARDRALQDAMAFLRAGLALGNGGGASKARRRAKP